MSKSSAQLSVERRIYPAGRALYFFGVAGGELAGRRFQVAGERANAIGFGRLSLVVRYVDQSEWLGEAFERHRADEKWLHAQAALHELVLERAMMRGPIVPARVLTVFPRLDDLEDAARASYDRWRRSLARVAGKEEWTLQVYHGPHVLPRRSPYVLRIAPVRSRAGTLRLPHVGESVAEHLGALWRTCSAVASGARQIELSGDARHLFGGTFLIASNRVDAFKETLEHFSGAARGFGLAYYLEGPRPPYTFA